MVTCIIGPPVTGDELFGREKEVENLWSIIENGSVLMVGPRRFGKTSITHEMWNYPRNMWSVSYLDIEDISDPVDFVIEILGTTSHLQGLKEKFRSVFQSLKDAVNEIQFVELRIQLRHELNDDWRNKANKMFEKIGEENPKMLFILDELPTMLLNIIEKDAEKGIENVRIFVKWLRQVRNNYNIRFIICGSVGLHQILEKCECVDAINDLQRIVIQPLSRSSARSMIEQLLGGYDIGYTDEEIGTILDEIGVYVPYFVKIFIKAIVDELENSGSKLTKTSISRAYHRRVLGVEGKSYFKHYFHRLNTYYSGKEGEAARLILDDIAVKGNSSRQGLLRVYTLAIEDNDEKAFSRLIEKLEDDFYITRNDSWQYSFYTKVLMDLWKEKLGIE